MRAPGSGRMFVVRALEKLQAEREIKKSHHSQLKKAVDQTLGKLYFIIRGIIHLNWYNKLRTVLLNIV